MKQDETINMAKQAGGITGWLTKQRRNDPELSDNDFVFDIEQLIAFAAMVRADEREACAKVCDDIWQEDGTAYDCREAIRARGQA